MLEGDSFLYRVALAILGVLEPRLFFPDRTELLQLLRYVSSSSLSLLTFNPEARMKPQSKLQREMA